MPAFKATLRNRIVEDEIFTGSGLDDLDSGGTHTLDVNTTFTVIIDTVGGTDTFKWKRGNGAFNLAVVMTGLVQNLSDGVTIIFAATTGHTLDDQWTIRALSFGIDASMSDDGQILAITDHSNYVNSTDVGHSEVDFESIVSRSLFLVLPDLSVAALATTQTILPHWDTANAQANSDIINYIPGGVIIDGVYELLLFTFPTWNDTDDYVLNDMVVRNGIVYLAILNPAVDEDPGLFPLVWSPQPILVDSAGQPVSTIQSKYFFQGKITLVFNILKCIDKRVFDSNCDISKNCTDDFATDPKQINAWKVERTLRAIEISNKLKEFDKAQQLVVKATALCEACLC